MSVSTSSPSAPTSRSWSAQVHGPAAGLPRQRSQLAEAARGHRRDDRYYEQTNANVHRGVHTLSEEATAQYEGARARCRHFIDACCPKEVIWTRNATEAINLVAYSWGRTNLRATASC